MNYRRLGGNVSIPLSESDTVCRNSSGRNMCRVSFGEDLPVLFPYTVSLFDALKKIPERGIKMLPTRRRTTDHGVTARYLGIILWFQFYQYQRPSGAPPRVLPSEPYNKTHTHDGRLTCFATVSYTHLDVYKRQKL